MSDQPQEWTEETVKTILASPAGFRSGEKAVAEVHNAALAAERERVTMIMATDAKMKIAAEREKVRIMTNQCVQLRQELARTSN